jgi:hypothetical protein
MNPIPVEVLGNVGNGNGIAVVVAPPSPQGVVIGVIDAMGLLFPWAPMPAIPIFGIPIFGIPIFGIPIFGIPMFGIPMFGIPMFGIPMFGIPIFGIPIFGIPIFGTALFGAPMLGIDGIGGGRFIEGIPPCDIGVPPPRDDIGGIISGDPPTDGPGNPDGICGAVGATFHVNGFVNPLRTFKRF